MKILIYNWKDLRAPDAGGAEAVSFEIARRLAGSGHIVTWFCRAVPRSPREEIRAGIRFVRRGNALTTYGEGFRYFRSLPEKPDLVLDMLNTLAWQTPLYVRPPTRVVQYVNQLAKEVWAYERRPPVSWIGRLLEPVQLLPYRNLPVLTYAASTADDLVAWGYDRRRIHLFRLGLDHRRYQPGPKHPTPRIVQVGRLVRMKRPDLTVRAFAKVVSRLPDAQLEFIGTGPLRPVLSRLVRRSGLGTHVRVPDGATRPSEEEKVRALQRAWILVQPSVKEGWGLTLLEAAACGTPAVATRVSGHADSLREGETGLFVSKDPSPEELAHAMLVLLEDSNRRAKLSRNCVSYASSFSWEDSYRTFREALGSATGLRI